MYPIFFTYKFLTIASYGVMLGLAFYLSFLLLERELKLKDKDPELAYKLLLVIIPAAIIGAKFFHIIEHFDDFNRDRFGMIFSGSGLSVYGGFLLAFLASYFVIKKNNENVLEVFDSASVIMPLGYAIGRLGCHTSGDGCYGIASKSIFAMPYPNGIVPISMSVLPTPLFESFISFVFFLIILKLRKLNLTTGIIFFSYLIMNGFARFTVEFFRLNPKVAIGLTSAQFTAIGFVVFGVIGLIYTNMKAKNDPLTS